MMKSKFFLLHLLHIQELTCKKYYIVLQSVFQTCIEVPDAIGY